MISSSPSVSPFVSDLPFDTDEMAPTIFQSPIYLENYRRFFGSGKRFHAVEAEGARVWLMTRGRVVKRLEMWGAGIGDLGAASSTRSENWPLLWREIESLAARHDMTQLAQLEANSPLVELARLAKWTISSAEPCPLLVLPDSWDKYLQILTKKMREQVKYLPRKLAKDFAVSYHLAQSEAEVEQGLNDLFALHGKRWRARGQTGVLVLPRRQQFQRALCRDLFRNKGLRLWTLKCDDKAVCALLFYFYNGRYSYFIGGFDPQMGKWSVGTCLFVRVIQSAIEDGTQEIDFLKGEEPYKYRLGATNREYVTLETFRPGARGKLMQSRASLEKAFMTFLHERFGAEKVDKAAKSST